MLISHGFGKFAFSLIFVLSSMASAQSASHGRLDFTFGVGSAQLWAGSPSQDIKMNNGTYFTVQAEKPFGGTAFYLETDIQYTRSTGSLNYNYNSPTNTNYVQNNVNYTLDDFGFAVGARYKFLDNSYFRPYLEAGGDGGYFQLTYDSSLKTPAVLSLGGDFKTVDGVINFGFYGEGGFEFDLTSTLGLRLSYRYMNNSTRSVSTLRNQQITYSSGIIYGGLFCHF